MSKGIQIKKPEYVADANSALPLPQNQTEPLSPIFYLMLILTFPAALVAIYFFIQVRPV